MAAPKKIVDKWKAKVWYSVLAPKFLNEVEVAQIPAQDDEHMMNRIIKIPMKEVTKDISHSFTTIKLRVSEIKGKTAYAKFIGHEVAREYIHALVRRDTDALNTVFSVKSKDGVEFLIKAVVLTGTSCSGSQKNSIRVALMNELRAKAQNTDFGVFIKDTLYGRTSGEIFNSLKKIAPLKRVEIRKTELKEVFDTEEKIALEGDENAEGAEGEGADENAPEEKSDIEKFIEKKSEKAHKEAPAETTAA